MSARVEEVVSALQRAGARLTGSWARGEETAASDVDFCVPERNWKRFVREAPPGWESVVVGHVGWRLPDVLVDVSTLFKAQKDRLDEREVFGVTWRTR